MKLNKLNSLRGQGLTEYALLLAVIALVAVGVMAVFGPQVGAAFAAVIAWIQGLIP